MKKLSILFGVSVLMIISCTTKLSAIYDESVPEESSAQIAMSAGAVTSYNGVPVNWEKSARSAIQIPAGETSLVWNIKADYGKTIYRGKDLMFAYNFKPMKKYYFIFGIENDFYGLRIYEFNLEDKMPGSLKKIETHFAAFVPFSNLKGLNESIILD